MTENIKESTFETEGEEFSELNAKLLEEYKEYISFAGFNEFNLGEKLENLSKLTLSIQVELEKEKFNLEYIKALIERKKGERYEFYRFENDNKLTPKEVEMYYLPKDTLLVKLNKHLRNQDYKVNFIKTISRSLERMGYDMLNWIKENR